MDTQTVFGKISHFFTKKIPAFFILIKIFVLDFILKKYLLALTICIISYFFIYVNSIMQFSTYKRSVYFLHASFKKIYFF